MLTKVAIKESENLLLKFTQQTKENNYLCIIGRIIQNKLRTCMSGSGCEGAVQISCTLRFLHLNCKDKKVHSLRARQCSLKFSPGILTKFHAAANCKVAECFKLDLFLNCMYCTL